MKKLILLLLFIPLVSFGQTQIINGIELNGRQGMVKVGDLSWEDDDSSLSVISIGEQLYTKKQKEDIAKQGNRYLNFEFSHNVEILDNTIHIAIFKAKEKIEGILLFQGQLVLEKDGFNYLIVSTSFSKGGKIADQEAIKKIKGNLGYMIARILEPTYAEDFGQKKSLEDYKNLIEENFRTQPQFAIEIFEKALIDNPSFSEYAMVGNRLIDRITISYTLLMAVEIKKESDEKLKQTILELITHLDKWKSPAISTRGIAYKYLSAIYYSDGLINKFCEAFLIAKELGEDFSTEESRVFSNACKDIALEENFEKSKLYLEIVEKAINDKVDEDFIPILSLSVAYNKNNFESLAGLSTYLIEKGNFGKNTVEKIKSINQRLINNINSEEFQSMGNFLNGNLYMAIIFKEWEKLEKEGLTKADIRKQIKESDEYKSSIFFFNEAIKINPNDIQSIYTKAMLEDGVEDYENACKSFKAIKEILEKQGAKSGDNLYDSIIININNTCN